MSKELKGYTNTLHKNENGTITKFFYDEGITSRPAISRRDSEIFALKCIDNTPTLISQSAHSVTMSCIEGEVSLDQKIDEMKEKTQVSVLTKAGIALKFLHEHYFITNNISSYEKQLKKDLITRTNMISPLLPSMNLSKIAITNFIHNSLNSYELKKWGITVTHGDYWLNNILGKEKNGSFSLTGIIDWEMCGVNSPYVDLAVVEMSIGRNHQIPINNFWIGYGQLPNKSLLKYFSLRQILIWMSEDKEINLNSEFYKDKIKILKSII